jgi:hypothetical protein
MHIQIQSHEALNTTLRKEKFLAFLGIRCIGNDQRGASNRSRLERFPALTLEVVMKVRYGFETGARDSPLPYCHDTYSMTQTVALQLAQDPMLLANPALHFPDVYSPAFSFSKIL